jgi:asparagine synthase (glutamine-hydrolysing)
MCGLVAMVLNQPNVTGEARTAVLSACSNMESRGPDGAGIWSHDGVILGHRRLAILDLDPRANQPMISSDGRYTVVFNGEIYNYKELRKEREAAGNVFRTTSDTEVLLVLFAALGEKMLPLLRGMFAFAIWDSVAHELFVARDPYGIKPIYYVETRTGILFASQVKALLATGLLAREIEPAGLAGFYLLGNVPEPWTIYRGVYSVPAGSWMKVRGRKLELPVRWHDIGRHWQSPGSKLSNGELKELVGKAVMDSVNAHLVADVPLCVFLSGGIDSSVMAGIASSMGGQVHGVTIGLREFANRSADEIPGASLVAKYFGLEHTVHWLSRSEFEHDIPRIIRAMDQPSIDGVNTWFVSKVAAELGYKAVLSGVGGDELFCGYGAFRVLPLVLKIGRAINAVPGGRVLLGAALNFSAKQFDKPKLGALTAYMGSIERLYFLHRCLFLPGELPALMGEEMALEGLTRLEETESLHASTQASIVSDAATIGRLDSSHYLRNQLLRDSDWASMAHSLELRTPLVDTVLLETLAPYVPRFMGGAGKLMLASASNAGLPDSIINRKKSGFGLPMSDWMSSSNIIRNQPINPHLSSHNEPWARRWARFVISEFF